MINIYLGRAGSGKTHEILTGIRKKFNQNINEKLVLIVPEQYTLQAEAELIKNIGMNGIINFEVLSFNRLIEKVIQDSGGLKTIEINSLGKAMILRKIFEENNELLEVYGKAYKKSGFVREISETISELKRGDITVENLSQLVNSADGNTLTVKKLRDISLIYDFYEKSMKGKFSDDEDKINYACEKIAKWDPILGAKIWIDGFSGFTEQEYSVISSLFDLADDVTIALTTDEQEIKRERIFDNTLKTCKKLIEIAENSGKELNRRKFVMLHQDRELKHLEENFFAYPFRKHEGHTEKIEIITGYDMEMEIEAIAHKILELVINSAYKWQDISIVTANLEGYKNIIRRVFSTYKIPYFIDSKMNVMGNSIIKFLLLSLECINTNFRQEKMIELLKTEYFGFDRQSINFLENYVLEKGIKGSRWFRDLESVEEENLNLINLNKFSTKIKILADGIKSAKKVREYIKALFLYIEDIDLFKSHESFIEELKELQLFDKVIENTQIWNKIVEVINQLGEISGEDEMDTREFYSLLETGFSEISLGLIPSSDDVITVGTFARSKLSTVKAIFVCGANDGVLPAGSEEYGLLMDEDKKMLEAGGFNLKSSMNFRGIEEEYNIYQGISKAREKIAFSYSIFNLEGGAMRPSMYIDKIKKIFPSLLETKYLKRDFENMKFSYGGIHEINKLLIRALKNFLAGEELSDTEIQIIRLAHDEMNQEYSRILNYLMYSNIPDRLKKEYIESLYSLPLTGSVSKLEKYVNCPFSYFVRYGLRPEERKYYTVELPDIGIIFHNSLERFGRKVFSENLNWREIERDLSDKMVDGIVDGIIEEYYDKVFLSTNSNKYLVNKIKRVVKRAVWVSSNQIRGGSFEPKAFEIEFSDALRDDVVPPIIVDINGEEKIYLEGRIDRLDLVDANGMKYARIIDYKSSDKKYSLSDVFNGLQMQLMIYMDAVIENSSYFRENEIYPGGVFYFKIDDPLIEYSEKDPQMIEKEISKRLKLEGIAVDNSEVIEAIDSGIFENKGSDIMTARVGTDGSLRKDSQTVSMEDFLKLMNHVKETISGVGKRIISGDISIAPAKSGDKAACTYCQYSGICQFDEKMKNNGYRRIKKYSNDEVIQRISGKVE